MARRRKCAAGDGRRAVAYLRVSTDDQNLGPEAQRATITAWARRGGLEVVAWREERVSGGAPLEDRVVLAQALADLRALGAGVLVVAKRDRLARDVVIAAMIEGAVRDAGARVESADGMLADDSPMAVAMREMSDVFAKFERGLIRDRTRAALRALRDSGRRHCRKAPFGSRWEDGRRVQDASESALVLEVVRMREAGESMGTIADALNAAGRPCRSGRWHSTQVRRVLLRASQAT